MLERKNGGICTQKQQSSDPKKSVIRQRVQASRAYGSNTTDVPAMIILTIVKDETMMLFCKIPGGLKMEKLNNKLCTVSPC